MPPPRATGARAAIAAVYFVNGCGLGLWAGHIPLVRRALGRPILSSGNGFFSLGAMLGAALAALLLASGLPPTAGLALAIGALVGIIARAHRSLLPGRSAGDDEPSHRFRLPTGSALALGVLGLLGVLTEGAMLDRSGVYLAELLAAATATAPLGVAAPLAILAAVVGGWVRLAPVPARTGTA